MRVLTVLTLLLLGVALAYNEEDMTVLHPADSTQNAASTFVWQPSDDLSWANLPESGGSPASRSVAVWINVASAHATNYSSFFYRTPDGSALATYRRPALFLMPNEADLVPVSSYDVGGSPGDNYHLDVDSATHLFGFGTWRHFAMVHADDDARVYYDGVEVFTEAVPAPPVTSTEPLRTVYAAGTAQVDEYPSADAQLYDLRWFNTSLTLADVQALHALGGPPVAAPSFTTHPLSLTVGEGATVELTCATNKYSNVQWQKGGTNVVDGGAYSGAQTGALTITSVQSTVHDGDYTCVATNDVGSTTSNAATLTIDVCSVDSQNAVTDNAVSIDVDASGIANDVFTLVVKESAKYSSTSFVFDDPACPMTWSQEYPTIAGGCVRTWTGTAQWNDVYNTSAANDCGLVRTVDGTTDEIVFTSDFRVVNTETLDPVRGVTYSRDITHKLPFELRFPLTVDVQLTSMLEVFAPLVVGGTQDGGVQAQLLQQVVNPGAEPTLMMQLVTSVQHPFILQSAQFTQQPALMDSEIEEDVGNSIAICEDRASSPDDIVSCVAVWNAVLTPSSPRCNFNGSYGITFNVVCQPSRSTTCPLDPDTDSVVITFTLRTSDHCGAVTDQLALSAQLLAYQDSAHTTPKANFVHGQTVYMVAETWSDQTSLAQTDFVSVSLTPNGINPIVLYDEGTGTSTEGTSLGFSRTADSTLRGPGVKSLPEFQFDVDSDVLGAPADGTNTVVVDVVVRATYSNGGSKLIHYNYVVQEDPTDGATNTQTSFSVVAPPAPGAGDAAATSSAAEAGFANTGYSQTVVFATCGVLALLMAVSAVIVKRAVKVPKELKAYESGTLQASSSQVELMSATVKGEEGE